MKLVMTLLVRDEADIVDAHISFHLNAGVDLVIAMDHRSEDGTSEILKAYERDGHVRLIRQDAEEVRQSAWVTSMARLASTEHQADWVINSDADEFWWPRAPSLKQALNAVPARYGVVYATMSYFLPRSGIGPFSELMSVRLQQSAPINNPLSRYRPTLKAVHRGSPRVVVRRGNHEAEGVGRPFSSWHPLEVLHFPDRSPAQFARKYANTVESWPRGGREPGAFVLAAHAAIEGVGARDEFDRRALADEDLPEASEAHAVVSDIRLRDVLRRLRSATGAYLRPDELNGPLDLAPPSTFDDVRHAVDVGVLMEADLIRLHREVDDLDVRLRALDDGREGRVR